MKRLWIVPLWIFVAVQVRADVTVRYQTDIQLNLPEPAKQAAQKTVQSALDRFANIIIRMRNGKSASEMGRATSIMDYPAKQVTVIDREHKTFSTLSLADFAEQVAAASLPQMPEDAKKALENTKTSVDINKTGNTETILGIRAEERDAFMRLEMPTPPDHPGGINMKLVIRIWTASAEETLRNQAVREFTGYHIYANAPMNPATMLKKMSNMPLAKDFDSIVSDNAMVLRMRMEMYMQLPPEAMAKVAIDPTTPMMTMTQEAAEISSAQVDETIFQIPTDYQKGEPKDLLKLVVAAQP
jgi:hypothetical protein